MHKENHTLIITEDQRSILLTAMNSERANLKRYIDDGEVILQPILKSVEALIHQLKELDEFNFNGQKEKSIFTSQEETDFNYTYNELQHAASIRVEVNEKVEGEEYYTPEGQDVFNVYILDLTIATVDKGHLRIDSAFKEFSSVLWPVIRNSKYPDPPTSKVWRYGGLEFSSRIIATLLTCGLLLQIDPGTRRYPDIYEFSEKMFRFAYWLKHKGHYNTNIELTYITHLPQSESSRKFSPQRIL